MLRVVEQYCDVSLPVPLDQLFTYRVPPAIGDRICPGCRVIVPFGTRRLTGVVLRVHGQPPEQKARDLISLMDSEPVLEAPLMRLANWIAEYYCAPLGEVLKGMLPLGGEVRRSAVYSLTEAGRDVIRQFLVAPEEDETLRVIALLDQRARSATFLVSKVKGARAILKNLVKRGWAELETRHDDKDPLRASAERLEVEFLARPAADVKLKKNERELLAFLELHPGPHHLSGLADKVKQASISARALAKLNLARLEIQALDAATGYELPTPILNSDQQAAFDAISSALGEDQYRGFLLEGVTGSGKTEVYMRSIDAALGLGKNALLLVPEIGLTPAVAAQFLHRFGKQVALLHSAIGEAERAEQWRRIRSGKARVIVGTRSGVFAPVQNLGLVIVDEEHDGSYKQDETPRYHGRDVALVRAKEAGAIAVLGSATPSIETRFNAESGKYTLLRLPHRIAQRPMPKVDLVDMRVEFLETKRQATFSRKLIEAIEQRFQHGEQTMLLLNRRGFSSFLVCRTCGERMPCINCAVMLTFHRRDHRMLCHYCGYAEKVPDECPKCGSEHIQFLGTGSERVEDELHEHIPGARIARLDRDSVRAKGAFQHILQRFRNGEIDILVGTQMIAKGHDIPNVTLVGVVLADIGLSMPDFRAAERSFQLLTQAAGRAGRGATPGQVIVQTLNPDHYAIRFAAEQDYDGFYRKELEFRKWLRYPPFAAFANVLVRAEKQEEALRMVTALGYLLIPPAEGLKVMGPGEAPVPRLKNEYRYQILLKASSRAVLRSTVKMLQIHAEAEKWSPTALVIDVDPISLM